ncbi:hypothetical protein SELMODRAFT_422951 [Selaginella moellendorffii]|uniref:Pentatricopeptide repeat-containing protein n=1 Tax=Selaginella moellendorffii TaxID=88036 RepID=D8SK31_SELML|nr:hypothetical protein SELMODRAFT_422951 [Selaginella moellendorffii]
MAASEQSSRIPESIDSDGGVCVIKVETIHASARGLRIDCGLNTYSKCGARSTRTGSSPERRPGALERFDPRLWPAPGVPGTARGDAVISLDRRTATNLEGIRKLHAEIDRASHEMGRDLIDPVVASCLVDAYGRCGSMDEAERFFASSSSSGGLISWSALVVGFSRLCDAERAGDLGTWVAACEELLNVQEKERAPRHGRRLPRLTNLDHLDKQIASYRRKTMLDTM